jgi:hypothetical protein
LTQQHQNAIPKVVHQMNSQLRNSQINTDLPRTTTATVGDPAVGPLQEIYETLNILSGGTETLNDDVQHLNIASLQSHPKLQTLIEDFAQVKVSTEESHSFLEEVKRNEGIHHQDLSSLKEKINDMQSVSYDGSFVWKITNFQEKMSMFRVNLL